MLPRTGGWIRSQRICWAADTTEVPAPAVVVLTGLHTRIPGEAARCHADSGRSRLVNPSRRSWS